MQNYNIINLSINKALKRTPFGTSGGYIKILEAPVNAEILIHLNDSNSNGIPLKTYHSIEAEGIDKAFITCNSVVGGMIKIVQAKTSKDFKMYTPVTDIKIEQIGDFSDIAVSKLQFIPSGQASQHTITNGNITEINTADINAIKFHASASVGVELNANGIKFPMSGDNEMFLKNVSNVKFHNDNILDMKLSILYSDGYIYSSTNDYINLDYIDIGYYE